MIRQAAGYLAKHPWMRKLAVSTPVVRDLAWRYVAGENLDAGIAAVRALNARGIKGTLNFVGTHVRDEAEAVHAADAAIEALRRIQHEGIDANYSLKLTQIGLDMSPEFCRVHLRRVLDAAAEVDNFVRIDMEESPYVDVTLALFEDVCKIYGADTVGIVLQSYLRHRSGDLERMIALDARVRLVKGGYWEPPSVAFNKKTDIDRAFERDAELLLTRGRLPAIASHDARILEHACRIADSLKLGRRQFEFQMLYGVRPDLQDSLVRQGYAVRCYVPYGGQWYAYFIGCIRKSLGDVVDRFTGAARSRRRRERGALVRAGHG